MKCYYDNCNGEMHIKNSNCVQHSSIRWFCNKGHLSPHFIYESLIEKRKTLLICKRHYKIMLSLKKENYLLNSLGPRTVQDIKKCIKEKTVLYAVNCYTGVKVVIKTGYIRPKTMKACDLLHYEFYNEICNEGMWYSKVNFDRLFYRKEDAFKKAIEIF